MLQFLTQNHNIYKIQIKKTTTKQVSTDTLYGFSMIIIDMSI